MIKANEERKGMECYTTMCGASMIWYLIRVSSSREFKVTDQQNRLGIDFSPMTHNWQMSTKASLIVCCFLLLTAF